MKKTLKGLFSLLLSCLIIVIVCYILFQRIFSLNIVQQQSMMPNVHGFIVSNRLAYEKREPQRGDVIVFKEGGKLLVKRIIGLPEETIQIYGGSVMVNGKVLNEPYLSDDVITDGNKTYTVPYGMYFVLGDNRDHSTDSRYFPNIYIDRNDIVGRTFLDFKSITDISVLTQYKQLHNSTK